MFEFFIYQNQTYIHTYIYIYIYETKNKIIHDIKYYKIQFK
jgi:hypothetical protein